MAVAVAVLGAGLVGGANVLVVARTSDDVTDEVGELRHAQVAIVPGSMVRSDGSLGPVVAERVDAGVALHEAGVVEKVLLSGDHGSADYDEPTAMLAAVLDAGVPAADVFTDHAGFSTWQTMRRAREVFAVDSAVVVTQDFHLPRAVDLGHAAGIDVQGYVAGDAGGGLREVLARVRGLAQATARPDVTGGPVVPITGDGRDSWAVAPAAATC